MSLRFLLLEDNRLDADVIEVTLRDGGIDCELLRVETCADFVAALSKDEFDLILADYALPGFNGVAALEIACQLRPDVPFIFVSGSLGEELAIETLKRGATDYVLKQRLGRLVPSVQRALRETQERRERKRAQLMLLEQKQLLELIATGHPLSECLAAICASVSGLHPGTRACFLLTDAQGATFNRSITPDFPASLREGLKDAPINDLCIGTCGEAVYRGEAISCADILNDDRWSQEWRDLCVTHGILACHSKPVMGVDGLPLGSLMLCFDKARMPTDWEYQLADFGTRLASIVFERDRNHLALREEEVKYRTLFESINQGFCICEMLFDENGEPIDYRFLKVNPAFETMTGLQQATGKTARELVPNLEAFWFEIYGKVVLTGKPTRFERQSLSMNNRWFDVNAFCVDVAQSNQFAILFTNISHRKQTEAEIQQLNGQLKERVNELQTLFELLPIGVAIAKEADCRTILTNPYLSKLIRVPIVANTSHSAPADERPLYQLCRDGQEIPVADLPMQYAAIHNTSVQDEVVDVVHPDGTLIKLLCYASPLLDGQNKVRGVLGAFVDITQRVQDAATLQENEERLLIALQTGKLGSWQLDFDTGVLDGSAQFKANFGLSPEAELSYQQLFELIHPEDRQYVSEMVEQAIRERIDYDAEYRIVWPDNSIHWILARGRALYDANAQPQRMIGVTLDISDRKLSEEALRLSEAQLQTLFDAAPLGIYLVDGDFRIRQVNPTARLVFGNIPDLIGRDFDETIHRMWPQAYADELVERFRHTLSSGEPYFVGELIQERRDRGVIEYYEWQINRIPLPEGRYGVVCYFRDISAQVLARMAIAQSEERLLSFVEADVVGILFGDVYGGVHEANDELLRIVGYTREDLQAGRLRWIDITPPEYLPLDEQHIAEAKARGACSPYEKEYIRKDGSRVPILVGYSLLGEAREESIAFILDLTERKQAESALRESESRFRLMVESAKDYAIFTLDLRGIIASWNSGAERLLGYTETEALGCNGRMIFTPEDREQGRAEYEMQTALTQGRAENERYHVRQDGTQFWASGLMMPLQDEAGNIQGLVKILQDKTAQRQANERLHLLYETTRDLLATEHPMHLMNNLFRKLSDQLELHSYYNYMVEVKDNSPMLHLRNYGGISEEAAESIAWIEFGEYLCGIVAQEQQQLVLNRAQIATHPHAKLVCSMGITAYAGYPLMAQGQLLGTLSFASLTRTHFTPEEIDLLQSTCEQMAIAIERSNLITSIQEQAKQLQQANRIKDEFLAVLSHELRSPLNPILGWSKLLQNGKLDTAKTKQALATIERNAKLQSELIEDLLDVSRILQGKLRLNTGSVDLATIIRGAIETVRLAAEAKAITVKTLTLNNCYVLGDATRLQQVVWNLLSNAVKFTPGGGRVDVCLEPLENQAQITIRDNGKGIAPEFLPFVFDYFRQEDGATTRKFGGLGLGLAIVRQIVELHGGTVKAESAGDEQGATFTVRLPLLKSRESGAGGKENHTAALLPTTQSPLTGLQILVVDDDTDTREFQAFVLEESGATVTAVSSGLEALQVLEQLIPDVLVSDVGMAEMDGYMLIQQIRSRPPEQGGKILAIALTAYAGEFDRQKAIKSGFQAHITKPVEPERLIEAIVSLLEGNA
jgi:PAS domain S-box-containing protein